MSSYFATKKYSFIDALTSRARRAGGPISLDLIALSLSWLAQRGNEYIMLL